MAKRVSGLMTLCIASGMMVTLGVLVFQPTSAQQLSKSPTPIRVGGVTITGVPTDWSHHDAVFSNPGTEEQAIRSGRHGRWIKIVNDPRYILQQLHRRQPAQGPFAADVAAREGFAASGDPGPVTASKRRRRLHKDWSVYLNTVVTTATTYPAKYSFATSTASCGDFIVFATGAAGSSTAATIVAFNNLYAGTGGCSGTVPQVNWQYNAAGGTTQLSPVLSLDGSQVAFILVDASGATGLAVLKWSPNSSLASLPATAPGSYRACAAPCMTSLSFANGQVDFFSSPYYDYANDVMYVGDTGGYLHKFTGVFNGTLAEAGGPWPVLLNIGGAAPLASPVFDPVSGYIFVGSFYHGYFFWVNSVSGAFGNLSQLDYHNGIVDAPLLDSTAERVYAFAGNDGTSICLDNAHNIKGCSSVFEFDTSLDYLGAARLSTGLYPLYSGAFDNAYFTSSDPGNPSGHLYTFGQTNPNFPQLLYQVTISNNAMTTASPSPYFLGTGGSGSPITEFYDASAARDNIFLSVANAYQGCGVNAGCIFGFNVIGGGVPSTPTGFNTEPGGTTGMVVDNGANFPGASQLYFATGYPSTCGSGGTGICAVQLSQLAP